MPSYIIQLFASNAELFRANPIVEKIFYGGEHFNESQKRYFQNEFGVKLIRSGGYGSVDAGPIGYQCAFCTGTVHHLHSRLHVLEILDLENDISVPRGEAGRVVLTSLSRAGQKIQRYDVGDLARILPGHCPCARKGPLLELLGRHGDVFRIGSAYFNYAKFVQIFGEQFDYVGELQIILRPGSGSSKEQITLCLSEHALLPDANEIHAVILDNYTDLREIVQVEGLLDLQIEYVDSSKLERTASSGKLRRIIDERTLSKKP
jgi:phenylacetate-coenzyme A ligase PaaK-like adenylate-forming protein